MAKTSRPLQAWVVIIINTSKSNRWNLGWIPLASGTHHAFCFPPYISCLLLYFIWKTLLRGCDYAYTRWVSHFRSVKWAPQPRCTFFFLSGHFVPVFIPHLSPSSLCQRVLDVQTVSCVNSYHCAENKRYRTHLKNMLSGLMCFISTEINVLSKPVTCRLLCSVTSHY